MEEVGYLIKRAQHSVRLHMDKSLNEIRLTLPQYVAMSHIDREAGISNAELARQAFITPQTMHRIVQGLESKGLITRTTHPMLERVQQLFLSEEGKQLLSKAHERVQAIETQSLTQLSDDEVQTLRELLRKYIAGLGEASA